MPGVLRLWILLISVLAGLTLVDLLIMLFVPILVGGGSVGTPSRMRILEFLVRKPSLLGESGRVLARFHLLRMLSHAGRHAEALAHGEKLLALKHSPQFEAEIRRHLANALEGVGRGDESNWQRAQASLRLANVRRTAALHIQSGQIKDAQGDRAGAVAEFEAALEVANPADQESRAIALLGLSLGEFNLGKIAESAEHAAASAELKANDPIHQSALRQASAAYATLGDIDRSEHFDRLACDFARKTRNQNALATALAHLAENLRKRGRLQEAQAAIEEALKIEDVRTCHTILYEIHRSAGRFEESLAELSRAANTGAVGLRKAEDKMQALFDFGASRILVELGRIDEAACRLERAAAVLAADPKLLLWCRAAAARIAALKGDADLARALLREVVTGAGRYSGDRTTLQVCHAFHARTSRVLGDFDEAIAAWHDYLEQDPSPVDQPGAYYNLGECYLAKGDRAAARAQFQRAVDPGIDSHEAILARKRLASVI